VSAPPPMPPVAPPLGRVDQVAAAHVAYIATLLSNLNLPVRGKVVRGHYESAKLLALTRAGAAAIEVNATSVARDSGTVLSPMLVPLMAPIVPAMTATVTGATITIGGAPDTRTSLLVQLTAKPTTSVSVPGVAQDTPAAFAGRLTAAIIAKNVPGVTASASGSTVTVSGARIGAAKVLVTVTRQREINRIDQRFQVTVWAANGDDCGRVESPIASLLGNVDHETERIDLGDGTYSNTRYAGGPIRRQERIEDAMLERSDILFDVEYGLLDTQTYSQVGEFDVALATGQTTAPAITTTIRLTARG